ncbi:MAG: trypsin-like peptidase domain-containing protein [Saprospiraceae bacterium]|nr:trypsin-like peptidase domain-containing protein [Saprospiraceae bacterium]
MAVGNPFRLQSTVTAGIVSAKGRNINLLENQGIESFIQTDAAVNPGNSGGALINTKGDLVGICTAILSNSGRYEGFSFAIPINLAKKVLADLKEFGAVQRGWLGLK